MTAKENFAINIDCTQSCGCIFRACNRPDTVAHVTAGEAVEIDMRWMHIYHMLRLDNRLCACSENSPLACVDSVPFRPTSQSWVDDFARRVAAKPKVRIQESCSLQLIEEVCSDLASR